MLMSRKFIGHSPKPARVTRTGAAPGQAAKTAPAVSTPRLAPSGKPTGEPTGKSTGKSTGEPTGEARTADTGKAPTGRPKEIGGPSGPEPTRYGDWERNGICVDF